MLSWAKSYKADLRIKKKIHFFWVTTEDRARNNWLKKKKEITGQRLQLCKKDHWASWWFSSLKKKKVKVKVLVAQSSPTLVTPKHCSPPDSSVHGILQSRILEWVTIPFSRGSSWPRDQTQVLLHCRQLLYHLSHQGRPYLPANAKDISRKHGFDPWVRKMPCRRKWQQTPVFFPGKSHGPKSPEGYHPCGPERVGHNLATKQQQQKEQQSM